jgi:hypothetical protein
MKPATKGLRIGMEIERNAQHVLVRACVSLPRSMSEPASAARSRFALAYIPIPSTA